ncbi:hypothetical protein UlMin_036856 [Ulmus minor]
MVSLRNLNKKTSTCKCLAREAAKTAQMKDKDADPYDLNQIRLETLIWLIPDCQKRLDGALADLKATVPELDQKHDPEIEEARTTISQVENLFSTSTTSYS